MSFPLFDHQDAPDSAREGDNHRVHKERRLQIRPAARCLHHRGSADSVLDFIGAFYLRLAGRAVEVYQYLEPLYNDYRKVRERLRDGTYRLTHVDEVVDKMLQTDHLFDIALPRIPLRYCVVEIPTGIDSP